MPLARLRPIRGRVPSVSKVKVMVVYDGTAHGRANIRRRGVVYAGRIVVD